MNLFVMIHCYRFANISLGTSASGNIRKIEPVHLYRVEVAKSIDDLAYSSEALLADNFD